MPKVGIGVVTFNRLSHLQNCIEHIQRHTKSAYDLVVADDGSKDGTREWCEKKGITTLGLTNKGVCWNKNRALFALQAMGCDPILLVEDDCYPKQDDWEQDWAVATAIFGHVSFAHPKLARWQISGSGTATDPIVNNKATAQCASISAEALRQVGYFDTRFRGYGVGHAEWTTRVKRAGFGFKYTIVEGGARARANLYISGGIEADDAPTFKDPSNVRQNEELFAKLKAEPIYRHPWHGAEELDAFTAELEAAEIPVTNYASAYRIQKPNADRGLRDIMYHKTGRQALLSLVQDERSFAQGSHGWLGSVASGIPVLDAELAPGFSDPAVTLLRDRASAEWSVVDLGAGYGAAWWAERAAEVETLTLHKAQASIARRLAGPRATVTLAENDDQLVTRLSGLPGDADILSLRDRCSATVLRAGLSKLSPRGIVVAQDSDAKDFAPAQDVILAEGFRKLRLVGLVPGTWHRQATSIFYRDDNCLGL